MTSLAPAIRLFHHRWSVPTVATIHRRGPLRFAELAQRLGASRDTLSDTLTRLEELGVIARERGPARPHYHLTPMGEHLAPFCMEAVAQIGGTDLLAIALKKWPMIVAVAIGRGANRYNEMKAMLPGITPRSLALALKDLQAVDLVHREVGSGYPPAATYTLTGKGWQFFPMLDRLCSAADEATRLC